MPDACSLAKGIAGGFPLGAMLVREKFAGALPPGTHASTFGGNPLACAAGLAVLDIFDEEQRARQRRARAAASWRRAPHAIVRALPKLAVEARGRGLLRGIVLAKALDPAAGARRACASTACWPRSAGGNVLRICPALTITADELGEGMSHACDAAPSRNSRRSSRHDHATF